MSKILYYTVISLWLLIFVFILNSGDIAKKPWSHDDDFVLYATMLQKDITREDFRKASHDLEQLKKAWSKIVSRIQYSVEKEEINAIYVNLARLTAHIKNEDKKQALVEIEEMWNHWHHLNQ
ncbi:protein of unknown function [Thermosyntropha lipolytica DSM 11003]|uniref:DUF4363 domain-containing protein n=1 Tax=Thermosyntropha lipolytica DSM 11003 TaxID=1123382 RepID=A0A1M5LP14_9FIRM|nr:DUF4363 family protein [Thermosyntropha lipolytica]SHG66788.1 protein of unknown function [Thermosyntropha lipolytica DSM 11003]